MRGFFSHLLFAYCLAEVLITPFYPFSRTVAEKITRDLHR
jgi:hypothetical protein